MDVLAGLLLADGPDAISRDFALDCAVEGDIQQEFAALFGTVQDAMAFTGLVPHEVFAALDDDIGFRLVGFHAFRRVLAADGVRFSLEVPESQIATEFFAGAGDVERREVDKGSGAVVENELVTPGFVEFLGRIGVRHEVADRERPFRTLRGYDVGCADGTCYKANRKGAGGNNPFPRHHTPKDKKNSPLGAAFHR